MKFFALLAVSLLSTTPAHASSHYHAQQIGSRKGFEVYLSNGIPQSSVFLPSLRTTRTYNSISPFRNLVRKPSSSNVVQQTKDLANTVTSVLEELANNPVSAGRVNQIISDNYSPCLTSIEDSIASLQSSSQLVESLGPEIQSLTDRFTALRSVTEPAKVVRETGAVLKLLQPLADKTAKIESGNCPESLRSLALLVTEISEKPELRLKFSVRENLKKSSATLSIVNVFLSQLEPTIARMKRFCTDDNQYNRDAMVAIGDLMLDLSNMYSSLGDLRTGEEFRYGKVYIDRVAAQLEKLEEVGLGQSDCVSNGDLGGAAEILDQLATLIEEAGIESLKEQLGADLSFDFDFDPATSAIRRFRF